MVKKNNIYFKPQEFGSDASDSVTEVSESTEEEDPVTKEKNRVIKKIKYPGRVGRLIREYLYRENQAWLNEFTDDSEGSENPRRISRRRKRDLNFQRDSDSE